MNIKILLKGTASETLLTVEQFEGVMGVKYLPRLHYKTPQLRLDIARKTQRAHSKGRLDRKEQWLGHYYAKEIAQAYHPDVTVAWIDESMGYGVWTNRDIPAFSYVGEYTGVVRRSYPFRDRDNYYCFDYFVVKTRWSPYFGAPYLIDARDQSNFTRYINHSDEPNLEPVTAFYDGLPHIILCSKQPIPKGTQLCYDYGPNYWKKRQPPKPLA